MPSPPRFPPRYQLLDSWRGLACLVVVLHHAGYFLLIRGAEAPVGGWTAWAQAGIVELYHRMNLGVPVFFVISGYCIAASMDAHRTRRASPWRFLGRRAWRIYPPYWAAVAVFAATVAGLTRLGWPPIRSGIHSLHLDHPGELTPAQWLGNLTLTETWRHRVLGGDPYRNLTRIGWTLCFEEQFYLVGFALLLLFPRRLFGALLAASALIFAVNIAAVDAGWTQVYEGIFPEYWYQFAVGLAAYWRLAVAGPGAGRYWVDAAFCALAALGVAWGSASMPVVAGFGLALVALRPLDDRLAVAPALAPLRACGRRCYSIYLVHLPACVVAAEVAIQLGCTGFWARALVAAPLAAAAGLGTGWLFFAAVEARFHNPAPGRSAQARTPAAAEGPLLEPA